MITVIDYGSGNLRSVFNAFRYLNEDVRICAQGTGLSGADKVVLPGVGSSRDAMQGLEAKGFVAPLLKHIASGRPFLGICLGLQLLFTRSEESGGCGCLGLVEGEVKLFPREKNVKVPQIGWNTVSIQKKACPVFKGIDDGTYFYFVHSYYCETGAGGYTAGVTDYGVKYTSALWKDNVFAVQFHPERSQDKGLKLLENFAAL